MSTDPLRIIFMGTPDFSVPALKLLVEAKHNIVAVYTQPPRPAGRGKKEQKSPIHISAEELGIAVKTPESLKSESEINNFRDLKPDVCVVVAYGQILPQQILDIPPMGCINIHASMLPRWRGAAPIHRAIMAGDKETGISIMQMEEGLDTGPVLTSESINIGDNTNVSELHDELSQLGARLVLATLAGMQSGNIEPDPQDHEKATYAKKIDKSETKINWNNPAANVSAMVRGLYPLAWFELGGDRVRVLLARPTSANGKPGEVLANGPAGLEIACAQGQGAMLIERLQRAGKGPMGWGEFSRGFDVDQHANIGKILG
ncbi:MAG: methionyl-tRNA formyltransferase [Rhodospirillaceae bacterium]|nr:methionyl-tRNA formyltransferase [Rhodospirillaceae bacterium]